jgi:UDP-GlcNAc:undecaprenyl-phosphate GlcNAc-1-phosphate transferase
MNTMYYLLFAPIGMILTSVLYYQFAKKFNIYDHPVGRSSHINRTITGFGIFVLFALLVYSIKYPYTLPSFFIIGLIMIATISFIDDIVFIKHFVRLIFQIFALTLMAIDLPFNQIAIDKIPLIIAAVIFGIGVLNAFNFMDGINGMLGLNSLVILSSFLWLNNHSTDENGNPINFITNEFLYTLIIGVVIFLVLNFRRKALVFAGDVGSISMAFIIFYLMLNLIFKTENFAYLLLFVVIGIDAGLTVIFKLLLRENIFVPHRDFLFKKLVHVGKHRHIKVSFFYAALQALISTIIIAFPLQNKLPAQLSILFIFIVVLCSVYIFIRNQLTKKRVLKARKQEIEAED